MCSLAKTLISLCPASFHIPRPNLPVTPGVSCVSGFFSFYSCVHSPSSLCWPAIGQGQGPADSRVWAGLLWVGWFNRLQYCGFLVFGLPSVGDHFHFSLSCIGEGNGNPLQCSCLENPRDGGAWWAASRLPRGVRPRLEGKPRTPLSSRVVPCFIPYSKAKFACYSRCFLTSYFCIPVPYNEKVLLQCMKVKSESKVAQSCLPLSDPMDCSLPGSSVHGIFQARVLEWDAIAFSVSQN